MEANATHHILARNFTLLNEEELLMILERRNHPDVRKWMVQSDPITPEEHLRYCASLKNRPERLQLFVEFDSKPACVISYKATDSSWHELADNGIYAFDPEPCSSSLLSNIIAYQLFAIRGVKVSNIMVRNENEIAIFVNQYYHLFIRLFVGSMYYVIETFFGSQVAVSSHAITLFPHHKVLIQFRFEGFFILIITSIQVQMKYRIRLPLRFQFLYGKSFEQVFLSQEVSFHSRDQQGFVEPAGTAEKVVFPHQRHSVNKCRLVYVNESALADVGKTLYSYGVLHHGSVSF